MSTDFVAGAPEQTCQEIIDLIRQISPEVEQAYYVYVVNEKEKLIGVFSLKELIVNPPETKLKDIMDTDLFFIRDDAHVKEAVELVAKYDLLAVPVLDRDGELKGIVTFDDVMDLLIPEEGRGAISLR
jgi:magnesium transporter